MDFFQRCFLICLMAVELWRDLLSAATIQQMFGFAMVSPSPVPYLHPFWELGVLLLVVECHSSAHLLENLIGALSCQPSLAAVALNLESLFYYKRQIGTRVRLKERPNELCAAFTL